MAKQCTHAESAAAQGKFWQMHDYLFHHQHTLGDADLTRFAEAVGLAMQQYARDMAEQRSLARIEEDREGGERGAITGRHALAIVTEGFHQYTAAARSAVLVTGPEYHGRKRGREDPGHAHVAICAAWRCLRVMVALVHSSLLLPGGNRKCQAAVESYGRRICSLVPAIRTRKMDIC